MSPGVGRVGDPVGGCDDSVGEMVGVELVGVLVGKFDGRGREVGTTVVVGVLERNGVNGSGGGRVGTTVVVAIV